MTGYNIKGIVVFVVILLLILFALFNGNFLEVGYLFLALIIGIVLYQVYRFVIRGATGWDSHKGTTRGERMATENLDSTLKKYRKLESTLDHIENLEEQLKFLETVNDPPPYLVRRIKEKLKFSKKFCTACEKSFNTETALAEHTKAKH